MENWKEIKEKSVKGERNLVRGGRGEEGGKSERKRWVGGKFERISYAKAPHPTPT